MNGTDTMPNQFAWFTNNEWVILITTIGLLIFTALVFRDAIKSTIDYRNRPQVKLKLIKNFENSEDGKQRKVTFLIYVHNFGKGFLSECKIRVRITNNSGNNDLIDNTGKKYQGEFISLSWVDEKGLHDSHNLYPAKNEHGMFKLPLLVTIPLNVKKDSLIHEALFGVEFVDPAKISWKNSDKYLKAIGKAVTFYFVFSISINSTEQPFEKKIRVAIPINVISPFKDDYILFGEKNVKLFFTEALYSFISLFRKYGDE